MKIPKKIVILGQQFKVYTTHNLPKVGGYYDMRRSTIELSIKNMWPCEINEAFLHEIIEIILVKRGVGIFNEKKWGSYGRIFQLWHSPKADPPADTFTAFIVDFIDTIKRNKLEGLFK